MKQSALLLALTLTANYVIGSDPGAGEPRSTDATLRALGKNVFVSRCAQCHDEDGSKKLPDGTTLLQRLARSQDPEARLQTRLKNSQERHAVMIYMEDVLRRLHYSSERQGVSPAASH